MDVRVECAMADEDLRFDGVGRRGLALCVEAAVDADDASDGRATAGEFEDGHAAEAVADGGDVVIGERMSAEDFDSSVSATRKAVRFGAELGDAGHDALAVAGNAFAVHVAGEGDVTEFGEAAGAIFGMVVEAGAAVNDEDAGSFSGE